MRTRTLGIALISIGLALAGWVSSQELGIAPGAEKDPSARLAKSNGPAQSGTMTASESERIEEGTEPLGPLPIGFSYVERIITIQGEMSLNRIPIDLSTFNGDIRASPSEDGSWTGVFRLRGTGATPDLARQNMDKLELVWSYTDGARFFLSAKIRSNDGAQVGPIDIHVGGGQSGSIELAIPQSVLASLMAETSNGGIESSGLWTDKLSLSTSNGDVLAAGRVADLVAETSNGAIDLAVEPWKSGAIDASSSNGGITIGVPEDASRGYKIRASTSNGEAAIGLQDGDAKGDEDETAGFVTDGFDARSIQVEMTAATSNGDVIVQPIA